MSLNCDPDALMAGASCFLAISPGLRPGVVLYLLNEWTGLGLSLDQVAAGAACFKDLPKTTQDEIQTMLVCQLVNGTAPANCQPNTLMAAASCFKGISPGSLRAAQIYALCNASACTPPDAPFDLGASAGDNEVTLTWPAVPGATSYNIKRGTGGPLVTIDTSAGSPYVDSTAVNGTTYFYTVSAVNACGESADSNQDSATPSAPENALVTDWASRVVVNGGAAPSAGTRAALSTFCDTLDSQALTSKMLAVNPFAPDSLIAALTPLIVGPADDPFTNHGFLGANLTVNGLGGAIVSDHYYLDLGLVALDFSAFDHGFTLYCYSSNASLDEWDFGVLPGIFYVGAVSNLNVTQWHDPQGNGTFSVANGGSAVGYFSFNRIANNNQQVFKASSVFPHASLGTNALVVTDQRATSVGNLYMYAYNNGVPGGWSTKRFSFFAMHQGLTLGESATFFNATQALRVSLGGGFI